jgi:hypothetical protein
MGIDHGLADRQPQANAGCGRFGLPRVNLSNSASSWPASFAGRPGPWSRTGAPGHRRDRAALTTMGAAPYLAAFSSRLTSTRSISTASNSTSGKSAGTSVRTSMSPSAARRGAYGRAHHFLGRLPVHSQLTAPLCRRAISSRLLTRALSSRACATSARCHACSHPAAAANCCNDSASPISAVSGVRTSCEMAASSALRRLLRLHLHHRLLGDLHVMHALQRNGDLPRQRVELLRLLGNQQPAWLIGALSASTPRTRMGASAGHSARPAPPAWKWPVPAGCALRQAQSATLASKPAGRRVRQCQLVVAWVTMTRACPPKLRRTAAWPSSATWLACSAPERSRVSSNRDCARRSRLPRCAPGSAGRR